MKAEELRIGNYVLNPNNNEVHKCTIETISDIQNGYLKREPIPLTEEWLLRFGFEKDRYNFIINFGFDFCVEYYYADNIYSFWIYTDDDWHCILNEIKYVHSLQNLIYALTGQELTLNEEI